MATPERIPVIGDLVAIPTHEGTLKVIAVRSEGQIADAELITVPGYVEKNIPWGVLIHIPKPKKTTREDFSQAAARIVREATERM